MTGAAAAAPAGGGWRVTAAAVLVLGAAAAWGFGNALENPLVFDDVKAIANNETIRSLSTALSPPGPSSVWGRPVANLSFALDYAIAGDSVRQHHLTNVVIHLLSALVLFGLVRRTLWTPRLVARYGGAADGLALAVALLWLAHPLQTASVTYVVQRIEALVVLFYLLTLYGLVRGAAGEGRRGLWQLVAVASCALGMASKEVMVTAPVVALIYDRVFLSASLAEALGRRRWLYVGLAASWLLLLAGMASMGYRRGVPGGPRFYSASKGPAPLGGSMSMAYLLSQPRVIFLYLRQVVWPTELVFDYHYTLLARRASDVVPYAIGLAGLLGAVGWSLWRRPPLGFLGVAFFFVLAPTTSIFVINQVAADHRMRLPLAAVIVLLVVAGYHLWQRLAPRLGRARSRLVALSLVALTSFGLLWLTRQRNRDYRSAVALWSDTARKVPQNPRAQSNLGHALLERGRLDEAVAAFDRALALGPRAFYTLYQRGLAHGRRGEHARAIADLSRALELEPRLGEAYLARADALMRSGAPAKAVADLERVLASKPGDAVVLHNLAIAHAQLGQLDRAWRDVAAIEAGGGKPRPELLTYLQQLARRRAR